MNAHNDFTTNLERGTEQQIQRTANRALGGILNWHDGVICVARFNIAEHVINRCLRQQTNGMTKLLNGSRFRECAQWAKEGYANRLF